MSTIYYFSTYWQSCDCHAVEYAYFAQLKDITIGLAQEGKLLAEANSSELTNIINIAENSEWLAGMQAQSLLNEFFDSLYFDPPILPNPQDGFRLDKGSIETKDLSLVTAFPNPTSGRVSFQYKFERDWPNKTIRIMDNLGTLIQTLPVSNQNGFVDWDTENLQGGIYFYSIMTGNHAIASGKLVVVQ